MSVAMRGIDASGHPRPVAEFSPGGAPILSWIKIEDLVVDDRYQRPIYGAGQNNVRRIAESFAWSKFAPLIVAVIEGGKYAIIDGQHRATAAALRGIESVPAQVVIADAAEQAAAFKAINGQVTRIHRLALQHAALAAGDPQACEVQDVAAAAGVTILRYPRGAEGMKAGETQALGVITEAIRTFGRDTTITALTCITETTNNQPGYLAAAIIKAICTVLAANTRWREGGGALLAAFDEIDLDSEFEEAKTTRRPKGTATWEILADRITAALQEHFRADAA